MFDKQEQQERVAGKGTLNYDDLGCQGNTTLGSSFIYTSPIQL